MTRLRLGAFFLAVLAIGVSSGCAPAKSVGKQDHVLKRVTFRDIAPQNGIDFQAGLVKTPLNIAELSGGGVGFLDYDGDGRLDLVLVGYSGTALYRNLG